MLRKIRQAKQSLDLQRNQITASCSTWKNFPSNNNAILSSSARSTPSSVRQRPIFAPESDQQYISNMADQATETSSIQRSLSLSSSSANESVIGDTTVAKLDVLLGHIEDIKKSVIEMDADLVYVQNSAKKATHNMLSHAAGGFNYGINEISTFCSATDVSSCPPTPTLEWDSNDINDLVMSGSNVFPFQSKIGHLCEDTVDNYDSDDDITLGTLYSNTKENPNNKSDPQLQLQLKPYTSNDFSSDTLRSPSPSSSSGQGSDLPSPEEVLSNRTPCENIRNAKVEEILREIKRLGIANDLLNELLKQVKRDSAYFEE